jgi:hypothetical protein
MIVLPERHQANLQISKPKYQIKLQKPNIKLAAWLFDILLNFGF